MTLTSRRLFAGPSRRIVFALTLAIAVLVTTTFTPRPAHAQAAGSVELVAQSSWVDDGGIFSIQVRVAGASPDSSVVVRVLTPWVERDDFLRQDLTANSEVLLELPPVVLGDAQDSTNEVLGLEILLDGPNTRLDTNPLVPTDQEDEEGEAGDASTTIDQGQQLAVLTSDGGSAVYPIQVSLLDGEGTLADSFLTSMIELPRQDLRSPLDVSIILEAAVPSSATPNASNPLDTESLSRLSVLSSAFAQHPGANMALSISPETLLALSRDDSEEATQIIDQLRSNLTSAQLLPNPLSELEEQAWFDADFTDALVQLYEAGSDVSIETIGIEPEPSVILLDRTIDGSGLNDIRELGVQGAIVRPAQLTPLDRTVFPQALTTSFLIDAEDDAVDPIPSLVADGGLANHFTNPGGAVFNANRMLADLVLLSLQNSGGRQSVVVNPPLAWEPDPAFLNIFLSGLERVPAIQGSSPLQALAETEITPRLGIGTLSGPLQRQLNPPLQAESLRSFRTEFSQAQNAIDSWSTVIGNDTATRRDLDELLYLSSDHRRTQVERDGFIEAVYSLINTQKDASITTPESETITLTGREVDVPTVLENDLDTDATVLLLLSSDELDFPEGSEVIQLLEPGPNRIDIPIIARASGDSPIRIQVFSPDGLVLLGSAEVLVRTFAFSGVGIAIGVIAIIVLFVWWLRHVRGDRDTVAAISDEQEAEAGNVEVIGV